MKRLSTTSRNISFFLVLITALVSCGQNPKEAMEKTKFDQLPSLIRIIVYFCAFIELET